MTDEITTVEFEDGYLATRVMNAIKMLSGAEVELSEERDMYLVFWGDLKK